MSRRLQNTAPLIMAVGLLVSMGLTAQDVVYTGCIRSADGSLYSVSQGTSPMAPCRAKDNQISWNMLGPQGPQGPPGPPPPPLLEVSVNCDEGQSINEALAATSMELVVEVQGVCAEYVHITRDNVTLRGIDGAVIDGATLPPPTQNGISVLGASNVVIENLTVQRMNRGISLDGGAGATLTNVVVQDNNLDGLNLGNSSSALLTDCTAQRNAFRGISAWESSSLRVSGTVVASNNGRSGFLISGSSIEVTGGARLEASNNGADGIGVQSAASAMLAGFGVSVATSGNSHAGIGVSGNSYMWLGGLGLESTGNGFGVWADSSNVSVTGTIADNADRGVWCRNGGLVSLAGSTVSNNRFGIRAEGDCRAMLSGVTVQGNRGRGMWLDGASAAIANTTISGNTGTDVVLGFGSRLSFDGGNIVGTVSCDGTQLIRGEVSCPEVAMAAAAAQGADAEPVTVMPEVLEVPDR